MTLKASGVLRFGGFGNQLFQVSAAMQAAKVSNGLWTTKFAAHPLKQWRRFRYLSVALKIQDGNLMSGANRLNRKVSNSQVEWLPWGYYQEERIPASVRTEVLQMLMPWVEQHAPQAPVEVAIHVRLGDMARDPKVNAVHGTQPEQFFLNAIEEYGNTNEIYVVTDDWKLFMDSMPTLSRLCKPPKYRNNWQADFALLATAGKRVISNSTFGWWAGWISTSETIAPAKWFANPMLAEVDAQKLKVARWLYL